MPRVHIPGLPEAFEKERRLREEVYLDQPHFVCGIPLNQITPRIFARLLFIRTPFIGGGEVTPGEIGQFLWACHRDYELPRKRFWGGSNRKRNAFLKSLGRGHDWEELEEEIEMFLDLTFFDAPQGSRSDSTPYACGIASMEYRMLLEPFRWDAEKTLSTPLRRLYQLMRCHGSANGEVLFNRYSDEVKDLALRSMNEDMQAFNELRGGLN